MDTEKKDKIIGFMIVFILIIGFVACNQEASKTPEKKAESTPRTVEEVFQKRKSVIDLDVKYVKGKGKIVFAKLQAGDGFTTNLMRKGCLLSTQKLFQDLKKVTDFYEGTIVFESPGTDPYGNSINIEAMRIGFDHETFLKINWEGVNKENLPRLAKTFRQCYEFQKAESEAKK